MAENSTLPPYSDNTIILKYVRRKCTIWCALVQLTSFMNKKTNTILRYTKSKTNATVILRYFSSKRCRENVNYSFSDIFFVCCHIKVSYKKVKVFGI